MVDEIMDPWNSRPLDVHRWSDHPEVKVLLDRLWKEHFPADISSKTKPRGPKQKTSSKDQLKVLILDLYVAWKDDPELCIGVSLSWNSWNAGSRYNALHISKKIIPVIQTLHDAGLLDKENHHYQSQGHKKNRTTRLRASEKLQNMFRRAKFDYEDIGRAEGEEIIILKNDKNKQIEYDDTPETVRWREELAAYNDLIAQSFIDIPDLQEPVIEIDDHGEKAGVRIGTQNTKTHRVFSRSSWDRHGRFYGGWWQRVNSATRARITIDDQPTVEVDFLGLHIAILYAEAGKELDFDPYKVPREKIPEFPESVTRTLIKGLSLIAINAKGKSQAYQAYRSGSPPGSYISSVKNKEMDKWLDAFLERNPPLQGKLFTDQGIRLMNLDGQITSHILNHFTKQGIPVLSVHDSYIINCWKVDELRKAMVDASEAVVGRPLATAIKLPGREEYDWVSDQKLQAYIDNRLNPPRTPGYVERLQAFERRTGRDIGPFDGDPHLMIDDEDGDADWD